jgi:hypothetical protein
MAAAAAGPPSAEEPGFAPPAGAGTLGAEGGMPGGPLGALLAAVLTASGHEPIQLPMPRDSSIQGALRELIALRAPVFQPVPGANVSIADGSSPGPGVYGQEVRRAADMPPCALDAALVRQAQALSRRLRDSMKAVGPRDCSLLVQIMLHLTWCPNALIESTIAAIADFLLNSPQRLNTDAQPGRNAYASRAQVRDLVVEIKNKVKDGQMWLQQMATDDKVSEEVRRKRKATDLPDAPDKDIVDRLISHFKGVAGGSDAAGSGLMGWLKNDANMAVWKAACQTVLCNSLDRLGALSEVPGDKRAELVKGVVEYVMTDMRTRYDDPQSRDSDFVMEFLHWFEEARPRIQVAASIEWFCSMAAVRDPTNAFFLAPELQGAIQYLYSPQEAALAARGAKMPMRLAEGVGIFDQALFPQRRRPRTSQTLSSARGDHEPLPGGLTGFAAQRAGTLERWVGTARLRQLQAQGQDPGLADERRLGRPGPAWAPGSVPALYFAAGWNLMSELFSELPSAEERNDRCGI